MKRYLLLAAASLTLSATTFAQSAFDAVSITQPDLKGTARYMSMGGAFGALGGDLTTLSQNPAGIGVYRHNDFGLTVNLDCQHSKAFGDNVFTTTDNQTKFLLNNLGIVGTLKLNSSVVPNLNIGFVYNKGTSFNRNYGGTINNVQNSLTNYVAGMSNKANVSLGDVEHATGYDPYNPNDGYAAAPWLSILGYDSYFMTPSSDDDMNPQWVGQYGQGTSGLGWMNVTESGSLDEYNIALGGNFGNVVYWGMNFDITNLNYNQESLWGEKLSHAYVDGNIETADWDLYNYYRVSGTGFNYQLGVIVKPIQELRLGLSYHTPTWYTLTETYYADTNFRYGDDQQFTSAATNNGYNASNTYNFRSAGKLIASAAGVIGNKLIVSADYEWSPMHAMKFSENTGGYGYGYDDDDWWWGYYSADTRGSYRWEDSYAQNNKEIKDYLQSQNTFRLGAELRVLPQLSVRAGYAHVSSPVKERVRNNDVVVNTAGTQPAYRVDNSTNYYTCGLGYRVGKFYVDMAYVYKHVSAMYHAYTPDTAYGAPQSPQAGLAFDNSQIVLSAGFKF